MKIRHNGSAQNAMRHLGQNTTELSKNLEKLSSGYKINRSADDAAGLAVSQKLRAQIMGMDAVEGNIQTGKDLVDTAEGSMQEIHAMLRRMKKLAAMSANGTYDDAHDRAALQMEADQLCREINRIADSSNFNGIPLLDGSIMGHYEVKQPKEIVDFSYGQSGTGMLPQVGAGTSLRDTARNTQPGRFSVDLAGVSLDNAVAGGSLTVEIGSQPHSARLTVPVDPDFVSSPGAPALGVMDGRSIVNAILAGSNGGAAVQGVAVDRASGMPCIEINGQKFLLSKGIGGSRLEFSQTPLPMTKADVFSGNLDVSIGGTGGAAGAAPQPDQKGKWTFTLNEACHYGEKLQIPMTDKDGNATYGEIEFVEDTRTPFDPNTMVKITHSGSNQDEIRGVANILRNAPGFKDAFFVEALGERLTITQKVADSGFTCGQPVLLPARPWGQVPAQPVSVGTTADGRQMFSMKMGWYGYHDRLTISYKGQSKDIHFCDRIQHTRPNSWARVDMRYLDEVSDMVPEVSQALNHELFGEFDLSWSGDDLILTQKSAGTGDATQFSFAMGTDIAGNLQFDTAQRPQPAQTGGLPRATSTVDCLGGCYIQSEYAATTSFQLTPEMAVSGCTFVFGNQRITLGDDIPIDDLRANRAGYLQEIARRLARAAKGNDTWRVDCEGNELILTGRMPNHTGFDLKQADQILTAVKYTPTVLEEGLKLLIGESARPTDFLTVMIHDAHTYALGIDPLDISTQDNAAVASRKLDGAIAQLSAERGYLGGITNRLDHTYESVTITRENIQDAESVLRDADMAEEVTAMTKNQILQQSAQAMLAQANQNPQRVLELLQ